MIKRELLIENVAYRCLNKMYKSWLLLVNCHDCYQNDTFLLTLELQTNNGQEIQFATCTDKDNYFQFYILLFLYSHF